jgi:CRP-like cAMP-binding protein
MFLFSCIVAKAEAEIECVSIDADEGMSGEIGVQACPAPSAAQSVMSSHWRCCCPNSDPTSSQLRVKFQESSETMFFTPSIDAVVLDASEAHGSPNMPALLGRTASFGFEAHPKIASNASKASVVSTASIDSTAKAGSRFSFGKVGSLPVDTVSSSASTASLPEKRQSTLSMLRQSPASSVSSAALLMTQQSTRSSLQRSRSNGPWPVRSPSELTRKLKLAPLLKLIGKVPLFMHLSSEQRDKLAERSTLRDYSKDETVIMQGEIGNALFFLSKGELCVSKDGQHIRTLAKNDYVGERALLFEEPRSATVTVSSENAELWLVDAADFFEIVQGSSAQFKEDLLTRIALQDDSVSMKDLKHIRVVGRGAFGVVRLVEHKTNHTRYALKRVKTQDVKRVKSECDLLAENAHPFIIQLVKTFQNEKGTYILTELITGGELSDVIQTKRGLPTSQVQFYVASLVHPLEFLAERLIVHRDLKPENVMLDSQGRPKVVDMGMAKKLNEADPDPKTYTVCGTPHYMAPEVSLRRGYNTKADAWSLGVNFFEIACGDLPFAGDARNHMMIYDAVQNHRLVFPSAYKDENGKELMRRMLSKEPRNRIGFDDIKNAEFFKMGHEVAAQGSSLFDKILGRELTPPFVPGEEEKYCDPKEVLDIVLSDSEELG